MADNVELRATEREGKGKNAARRLRKTGMVPAVLYGDGDGWTRPLAVPTRVVDYTLQHVGDNALYDIVLGRGRPTARIVDVQRDPVTRQLVHVDFTPVNMRELIEITVPLTVTGEAVGVREEDGVLQQVAYELQVECLPGDIPQEIELDVTELAMNENLTLADIELPEGITLISDPEEVAVTITTPTEITAEEEEEAGIVEEEPEAVDEEAAESVEPSEEASEEEE